MTLETENIYLPEGSLILTEENNEYLSSLQGLEKAMNTKKILEANAVLCDNESNLHVDLLGIRGIIPKEQCIYCRNGEAIKDIAIITRVGKPVCFKITEIKKDDLGIYFILSRKAAQKECLENYISKLSCGDIVKAKVTHIESFGAFLDIGCGISSLLSIDNISVSRISSPNDRLQVGDNIYTVVKSIDENGRIFMSLRELLGTWEENASSFSAGSTVAGIIRSIESYGVFVELAPNLVGLAELREGLSIPDITDSRYIYKAAVYIKSMIKEKMKVKLVLIDYEKTARINKPLKYFINPLEEKHIDRWTYSPPVCEKIIETNFNNII